ncbi:probable inactive receptor kinase At1g48480 [Chenopodium quinoa]|uniref:probable inactive receptor kinase At1g48480 n=1 Tax=Chenopodium quinoa TaxID=63459 RepID=UPI000B779422|nr:probable inactive receptor kinase At1g48480 [Chenopodium quinoa]
MGSKITANFLLFLLIVTLIPSALSDLSSSRSALISLSSAVGGRTILWNTSSNSNPCSWSGVQCKNDAVIGLHLPGFSLSGEIPTGVFSNLTSLATLSLRFNELSGNLPSDLGLCSELRNIYLQDNKFGGEIPEFFSGLKNLVRLNLANNNFSGEVPGSLRNLSRLKTLYLQENNLRGFMPELKLDLDQFNVSGNNLNGSIPVSLSSMPVTAFQGNKLCGKPLQICPGLAAGTGILTGEQKKKKKKGLSGGAIAGIVIGAVVAFALILMIIVFVCGKKRNKESNAVDLASINKQLGFDIPEEKPAGDVENGGYGGGGYSVPAVAAAALATPGHTKAEEVNGGGVTKKLVFFGNGIGGKMFDLEELLRASAEVLGKGTFGTAYKAVMEMGTVVAVKRLKDVILGEVEFKEKIEAVGAMEHENLVPLRAYYYSRDEKLLVFDYMPTGSLSAFLHGNKGAGRTPLNWELRSSIALGVARGITYLHSRGSDVSHGNIKSSNVLLTKSYEPRVSDFGLAQLVGPSSTPTRVNGYRAPEVTEPRKVSQKADVYSFGVLLLELLTGKAPTHALLNEEGVDLPRWVQSVVKDDWASEVFDLELLRYQHAEEEMVQLLQLAVDCAAQYPDTRPSMLEVTKRIEELCSPSIREVNDPTTFIDTDDGSSR